MQNVGIVRVSVVCLQLIVMADWWMPSVGNERVSSMAAAGEPTLLDPVVVTGTQVALPVSEIPSAVTVIEREEIESRQITDVFQLLRTVPGLSVTQSGSRGGQTSVFPRGGNTNFSLVLIDGVPVNNAGGAYDFSDLTTDLDYQPIEALKMAFSARYSDSHFENPTESAGDRLSPLDPDQYQDRQRLILSLRTTHAITRWWEQVLLLGYNRNDSLFRDPFNAPVDFADSHTDSEEQRFFLNYFWNMTLPEFYQVVPT